MDPPLEVVKVLLDAFPLSCLDMEGFFTACQFAHPNTSRRSNDHEATGQDDGIAFDTDDVGEVIKLVMHETIRVRRLNNIDWGMVAFLGDARISPSHARLLLLHFPEAVNDSNHGTFGVSPLDRMVSGYFIHGETSAWVEKLRLALRVTAFVRLRREQIEQDPSLPKTIVLPSLFFSLDSQVLRRRESRINGVSMPKSAQSFHPYHELIRLLVSPNFQGTIFGKDGFLKTLQACTQSDPNAFLRMDDEGNLPLHLALKSKCETALGVKGERRLIKYLLDLDPSTSLCLEGSESLGGKERRLPLRLSIENGWPVFDYIVSAALACCEAGMSTFNEWDIVLNRPLLHDALDGPYHPQFGIYLVREMVKHIIAKVFHHRDSRDQKSRHSLTNPVDNDGRTALHLALESRWPVYDLIAQAYPNFSLEVRDPTRFGFFPFQVAACAFISCGSAEATDAKVPILSGSEDVHEPIIRGEASRSNSNHLPNDVTAVEDQKSHIELSMLFEIIRECPHCVTWSLSDTLCQPDYPKSNVQELNQRDDIRQRPLKRRRRSPVKI